MGGEGGCQATAVVCPPASLSAKHCAVVNKVVRLSKWGFFWIKNLVKHPSTIGTEQNGSFSGDMRTRSVSNERQFSCSNSRQLRYTATERKCSEWTEHSPARLNGIILTGYSVKLTVAGYVAQSVRKAACRRMRNAKRLRLYIGLYELGSSYIGPNREVA